MIRVINEVIPADEGTVCAVCGEEADIEVHENRGVVAPYHVCMIHADKAVVSIALSLSALVIR